VYRKTLQQNKTKERMNEPKHSHIGFHAFQQAVRDSDELELTKRRPAAPRRARRWWLVLPVVAWLRHCSHSPSNPSTML
jgi:hypothetical protein